MKILLFGTGDYYQRYKRWFSSWEILALLDNDVQKQGTEIDGHRVVSPSEGIKLPFDKIVILSAYYDEMKEQLISLRVPEEKIETQFDLNMCMSGILPRPVKHYNRNKASRKFYFFMYDLHRNGASIVFMYAIYLLRKNNSVCIVTLEDGPLRDRIIGDGIELIIDPNLQIETLAQSGYEENAELIFCNTFNFYRFLQERNTKIPVIWWLHDMEFYYHGTDKRVFAKIPKKNLYAYAVSPIAAAAFHKYCPDCTLGELPYGLPDFADGYPIKAVSYPINFAIIGHLQPHKAQDVFIKAAMSLPISLSRKARFFIVGSNHTLFANQLKELSKGRENIYFLGEQSRNQIARLYRDTIHVLVCPSRTDSLPTVAAEAMMYKIPCIVSDSTGTASHIQNGVNGWVVPCEDIERLSNIMELLIRTPEQIVEAGENARKVYEKMFSLSVFEKRLHCILRGLPIPYVS